MTLLGERIWIPWSSNNISRFFLIYHPISPQELVPTTRGNYTPLYFIRVPCSIPLFERCHRFFRFFFLAVLYDPVLSLPLNTLVAIPPFSVLPGLCDTVTAV